MCRNFKLSRKKSLCIRKELGNCTYQWTTNADTKLLSSFVVHWWVQFPSSFPNVSTSPAVTRFFFTLYKQKNKWLFPTLLTDSSRQSRSYGCIRTCTCLACSCTCTCSTPSVCWTATDARSGRSGQTLKGRVWAGNVDLPIRSAHGIYAFGFTQASVAVIMFDLPITYRFIITVIIIIILLLLLLVLVLLVPRWPYTVEGALKAQN